VFMWLLHHHDWSVATAMTLECRPRAAGQIGALSQPVPRQSSRRKRRRGFAARAPPGRRHRSERRHGGIGYAPSDTARSGKSCSRSFLMVANQLVLPPPRPRGLFPTGTLKRQISEALMRAMAASLNVRCVVQAEDIDSVDIEFDSGRFGPLGVALGINRKLEVQLKCTTAPSLRSMPRPTDGGPSLRYYLAVKDYDRLAIPASERPYPPRARGRKSPSGSDALDPPSRAPSSILRAKAWWLDLTDAPPATHPVNEPVYLPVAQVLTCKPLIR